MATINAARLLLARPQYLKVTTRTSTHIPQGVFLEKNLEVPVIVLKEEDNIDIIGPPEPISNLRPIIRKVLLNESELEKRLRTLQDATQVWNKKFWEKHNSRFIKEKQDYIDSYQISGHEKKQLTADEMSEFYKEFLDKNWHTHVKYNFEWYKKNFTLLFLSFRVNIERCMRFL